jgi:hypothetical protein
MITFRLKLDAECVAVGGDLCLDGAMNLSCFECGDNGGACQWLCIDNVSEIK